MMKPLAGFVAVRRCPQGHVTIAAVFVTRRAPLWAVDELAQRLEADVPGAETIAWQLAAGVPPPIRAAALRLPRDRVLTPPGTSANPFPAEDWQALMPLWRELVGGPLAGELH
jgi:hypothetical protein